LTWRDGQDCGASRAKELEVLLHAERRRSEEMEISIANQAGAFRKEIQRLRWQLADEEEKMKKVAEEVLEELPMTPRSSNPATPRSNHAATPRSFKKY